MNIPVHVQVPQPTEDLVHDGLDGIQRNVLRELVRERLEIVVCVLKQQLYLILVHHYTVQSIPHTHQRSTTLRCLGAATRGEWTPLGLGRALSPPRRSKWTSL